MKGKHRFTAPLIFAVFTATLTPWLYNFPLNDDWAYAIGVKHLLEQGRLLLCDWASATQIPHLICGALFSKLLGFSFLSLKLYNLLAAAALLSIFTLILEELEIRPFERLLAALALAINPIFLTLSNSFMTDITYLLWMLATVYLYMRHLRTKNTGTLIAAGLCGAVACLTRQLGIAMPLAYTFLLFKEHKASPKNMIYIWLPAAAALGGYWFWFKYTHGPTWASENYVFASTLSNISHPITFVLRSLYRMTAALMESGLLLLPLAAGYFHALDQFHCRNQLRTSITKGGLWLVFAVLIVFALFNGPLPYLENTLHKGGIGVLTLGSAALKPSAFFTSSLFWWIMTLAAIFSSMVFAGASCLTFKAGTPAARFVLLNALLHLGISLLGAKFFDRYLLPLLPWFIIAALFTARGLKFSKPAAVAVLVLMAAVNWAGMKDYLQWNRAKWELAARPRPDMSPTEIANGFDYEAWHTYERNMAFLKNMKPLRLINEWEWQQMNTYKGMISFGRNERFQTVDTIEYDTPLSRKKGILYLHKL